MTDDSIEEGWEYATAYPREPRDRYYAALGRLMHFFGAAEEALAALIKDFVFHELDVDRQGTQADDVIKALTGGMRVSMLRDTIKRLMRVTGTPDAVVTEVNSTFEQLGEIHFFRDRVAHHGTSELRDGRFVTSTDITAKEIENAEWLGFTPELLIDMAYDVHRIPDYLDDLLTGLRPFYNDPDQLQRHIAELRPTWRYKPSALVREGLKSPQSRGSQKRQPKPSEA
jgi:hypothetical protein